MGQDLEIGAVAQTWVYGVKIPKLTDIYMTILPFLN
mgnify:CR=1 FL=1